MRFILSLHALKSIALRGKSKGGFGVGWRRFSSEWDDLGGPPPVSRPSPKQPSASSVKPKVSSWREREGERGSKVFSRERDGGNSRGGSGVWGEGSEQEGRGGSSGRNPSRPSFDRFRGEGRGDRGSSRPSFASEGGIKRDTSRPPYSSSRTAPPSSSSFQRRDSEDGFSRGGIPSSRGKYEFEDRDLNREPAYGNYDGDHLYGVSPVRLALGSMRRNISELLVQSGMDLSNKKDEKLVSEILSIAKEKNITVTELSKHDLNMLTDNRPHQGFVLRATPLEFTKMEELAPSEDFKCVLALDEVWDPQNFGALLRTAHFLACDKVVVCSKNSAPLSPTVSKASAGAMELMDIGTTSNLMRFLDRSKLNGWQVVGTSLAESAVDLQDSSFDQPTILVLGNEGYGVRTNIMRRCDKLVKITGLGDDAAVDSLNVSVTGGILLYSILSKKGKSI